MADLPKVTIIYSNGNLLQDIDVLDGIAALVGTGVTSGLLGVPLIVYNLTDAETQGITATAEPTAHRHLSEFYAEVGGNQELHLMLVPDTMTMAQMLTDSNVSGAKKLLNAALGRCRLLGVFRRPSVGYAPGAAFLDADVSAAVTISKTFGDARLADLYPIRMLIEGRVTAPSVTNAYEPKTADNGYAGIVLGGSLADGSGSVGTALGRAVKYGSHIKIGKVANGPLALTAAYIGDKTIDELQNIGSLGTTHAQGFISFMRQPSKAGFYFGIDNMCSTTDFKRLVYGRVCDKAAVICAAVCVEKLEGEITIGADGNIDSLEISALVLDIKQQVNLSMSSQYSGFGVTIDPTQDVINTSRLAVKARVLPKGYTSYIDIDLGLTTSLT